MALALSVLASCSQSGGSDDSDSDDQANKVTAQAIEITLTEDTPSDPLDVLQDIDDNSYNLAGITQPAHGISTINADGLVEYQPAQDYVGDDTFTYTISNGTGEDLSADILVHITPVNDPPVADAGGPYITGLTRVFSPDGSQSYDVDGDTLTFHWRFGDGTESTDAIPNKTYASPDVYNVQLTVNDGIADSQIVETTVNVVAEIPFITQQPQSISIQDGNYTTFSVQAYGNGPLQYQWRKNGIVIPGATDSSYTTPAIYLSADVASMTIDYDVVITNNLGELTSEVATLTVNASAPFIYSQPQNRGVVDGEQYTLRVDAQGTPILRFQWRKNDVNIFGANGSRYTIPQAIYGETDGIYDVVISNVAGVETSSKAQITVLPRPVTISQPPIPQVIGAGETALFTVVATGTPPLSYQWQYNNVDIAGATAAQYEIPSATLADGGDYRVVVTNPAGNVTTPAAPLVINKLPPQITTQPVPVQVVDGASASFSVVAQDDEPITYQWRRNGVDIPGATSATLVLNSVTLSDDGHYFSVVVSNSGASVVSNSAPLSVTRAAAYVAIHPMSLAVYEGNSAMFSVAVGGTAPISYQWRRNGVNIPGANNAIYMIQHAQFSDNGSYDVYVYNNAGSDTSTDAELVVMPNAAPQASRDEAITRKNNAVTIDVLNNDTDNDGDTLTIQSASNGAMGTVSVVSGSPDTVLYTPQADQYGKDTFTYVVNDGKGKSAIGEVVVHVTPWGPAEIIGSGEGPSLASSTSQGDSFLTWRSGNNSASSIWGTRYIPGNSWIIPQAPLASGELLNNQHVHASYFGAAHVLWQNTSTQTGVQLLQHAEWNGLDWVLNNVERSNPDILDPITNLTFTTNNDRRFSAVWVETDAVTGNKRVAWSYALGITQYFTDGSTDVDEPTMAIIDNNTPVFIWKDVASGNLLWRYGVTVIQPANDVLNEGGNNIRQPQIALNGSGQGIIAWLYDGSSYTELKTRRISVTDTFTDPVLGSALSHPLGLNVLEARLAVAENGNIAVVWTQDDNASTSLWIKRMIGNKEVIEKLAEYDGVQPANPDVTMNSSNGMITVVWEAQGNVFSRRFEANGVWSPIENLDDAYTGISSHVVVDSIDNGQVTAAWQRDNGEIVTSIASIDLASVTPLPVNHTNAAFGSCNNAGCHALPTGHITTTAECDSCHFNTLWKPTYNDYSGYAAMRSCKSCHDSVIAQGKGSAHIPTSTECNACHTTESWLPSGSGVPDHTVFVNNCIFCHDGVTASGKGDTHINTTNLCDACHAKFPATWAPVAASAVDHSQVIGTCASCHDGVAATGKSGIHPTTTNVCDACHFSPPGSSWLSYIRPLDHTQVLGTCSSCHSKLAGHPTTTDSCENCHRVPPTPWANVTGVFSHADALDACESCHNLPAVHCAPAGSCDSCHSVSSWRNPVADCPTILPPP